MKRLKFKNPLKGLDNAKKLIPEAYKVDGKEFEMTDGNETYRLKWESDLNEATVLTSNNKSQINEDMNKIKHLMGFKSQDTLGTVKGAARLDEDKKFNDILGKSKSLISEGGAALKSGMGGSNKGKSRTDKTEVLKKSSKKKRRVNDKNATQEISEFENKDVEALGDALNGSPKVQSKLKLQNTIPEKVEGSVEFAKMMAKGDKAVVKKTARQLTKIAGDVEPSEEDSSIGNTSVTNESVDRLDEIFEGMDEGYSEYSEHNLNLDNYEIIDMEIQDRSYSYGAGSIVFTAEVVDIERNEEVVLEGEVEFEFYVNCEYDDNSFDHEYGTHDPGSGYAPTEMHFESLDSVGFTIRTFADKGGEPEHRGDIDMTSQQRVGNTTYMSRPNKLMKGETSLRSQHPDLYNHIVGMINQDLERIMEEGSAYDEGIECDQNPGWD